MSSFDDPDEDLKALRDRLSKLKNPSGKEPASFEDLSARYECLSGKSATSASLDDLNKRFAMLHGDTKDEQEHSYDHISSPEMQHTNLEDINVNEDDDFMDFINENLSDSSLQSAPVSLSTFDESRLHSAEQKCDMEMEKMKENDQMADMEEALLGAQSSSIYISENLFGGFSQGSSMKIPNNEKDDTDILLDQARDEVRLLRKPTYSAGPSGNMSAEDQVREQIMAAQDAAFLEKKYGITVTPKSDVGTVESQCEQNTDDGDESLRRSYGSNISDESSLEESD